MAAYDFSSLLQLVELAHRRLQQENYKLLEENKRLNDVLSGKLRGDQIGEKLDAEGSFAWDRPSSTIGSAASASKLMLASNNEAEEKAKEEAEEEPEEEEAEETRQWWMGRWIDITDDFFSGSNIVIAEHDWAPKPVKGSRKLPKDSTYSMAVDEGAHTISLREHRANGQTRTFKAEKGPPDSDTIIVWLKSDPEKLRWTLQGTMSRQSIGRRQNTAEVLLKEVEETGGSVGLSGSERVLSWGALSIKLAWIKAAMCLIIIVNMVSFGISIHFSLPGYSASDQLNTILNILDVVAFATFIVEIGVDLSFRHWRKEYEPSQWLVFNIAVTAIDTASAVICLVKNERSLLLRSVVLLRSVRLLRVAKFFQHLQTWKVAWQLAYGLMTSATTVISMFILLLLILYVFACIGLEVITKDEELIANHPDIIENSFGSLLSTMITMFQFVLGDGVNDVYAPLIKANPLLLFYFVPVVLLVSISLMNMVTGVIVEGAMKRASDDRDEERMNRLRKVQEASPVLKKVFTSIAKEDEFVLRQEEFDILDPSDFPEIATCLDNFRIRSMSELFDMLDESCKGEITEHHFVAGMLSLMMAEIREEPCQLVSIHKLHRATALKSRATEKMIQEMNARQFQLSNAVAKLQKTCDAFLPSANLHMVHIQRDCHSVVDGLAPSLYASSASKLKHKTSSCDENAAPEATLCPTWCKNPEPQTQQQPQPPQHPPTILPVVRQELPRAALHTPLPPPPTSWPRAAEIEVSKTGLQDRLSELEGECSWRDLDTRPILTATTASILPEQANSFSGPLIEGGNVFENDWNRYCLELRPDYNLHSTEPSNRAQGCVDVPVEDGERLGLEIHAPRPQEQERANICSGAFEHGTCIGGTECIEYAVVEHAEYTEHAAVGDGSTIEETIASAVSGIDGSHVRLELIPDCNLHSTDPDNHGEDCVNLAAEAGEGCVNITVEDGEELGFAINWCSDPLPLVEQVLPGSASDLSGVLQGDQLMQCNGISIADKCRNEILPLLKKRPLLLRLQRNAGSG